MTLILSAALKDETVTVSDMEFAGTMKLTIDGAILSALVEPALPEVVDGEGAEAAGVDVVPAAVAALFVAELKSSSRRGGLRVSWREMATVALLLAEMLPAASFAHA